MTRPSEHVQKVKIRAAIMRCFAMLKVGDEIRSDYLYTYCRQQIGKKIYPDTIFRYARQLREHGKINYTCICKRERKFKVIEIGQPHSL